MQSDSDAEVSKRVRAEQEEGECSSKTLRLARRCWKLSLGATQLGLEPEGLVMLGVS